MDNQLTLRAVLAEAQPLRHTPAGLPAIDVLLTHESVQAEAEIRGEGLEQLLGLLVESPRLARVDHQRAVDVAVHGDGQ